MKSLPRLRLLLALAAGLALALAFPPYGFTPLVWVAPAALIFLSLHARRWVAPLAGLLFGAGYYTLTLPWVYTVMRVHGEAGPVAAAAVLALMVLILAAFTAAFAAAVRWLSLRSIALACLAAPFLWVALELGRAHMPILGFPWLLLGYGAVPHLGLIQVAAVAGIYGVSFLLAGYNALFAWMLAVRTRQAFLLWLATAAVLLPAALMGHRFLPPEALPAHTAHLVQPNFAQTAVYGPGWLESNAADLEDLVERSVAAARRRPGVVVWPEVPAPFTLQDPRFAALAGRVAREGGSPFLVGVVELDRAADGSVEPYNSAVLLGAGGERLFRYDKMHLVPFGEYVPLRGLLRFAESLTRQVSDFRHGREARVGELPGGGTFGVLICYEAIFPAEVRRFSRGGAEVFINVSNDGWFVGSGAPEQHLLMARVRSIEHRRWLLRGTNTGHTVAVDPYGRITARLDADRRGVLSAAYDFRAGRTLYALLGDWLAWLCVAASGVLLWRGWKRVTRT